MKHLAARFMWEQPHLMTSTRKRMFFQLGHVLRELEYLSVLEPWQISEEVLVSWCSVRRSRISPETFAMELRLVHRFLSWLVKEGRLLTNPVPQWLLESLSDQRKVRPVPSVVEVENLVAEARKEGTWFPVRNEAVIELLYGCGLRNAELSALDLSDWRGESLKVTGKGGKERVVPVSPIVANAVDLYLRTERVRVASSRDIREKALFLGAKGKRLTTSGVRGIFKKQLGTTLRPHRLRHACATHMLHNGADLVTLKELLGHEVIATTQIYTEVRKQDLRRALQACHPRG